MITSDYVDENGNPLEYRRLYAGRRRLTGAELTRVRKLAGLTQGRLAQELGVSTRQVVRWELEESPIHRIHVLALAALVPDAWKVYDTLD